MEQDVRCVVNVLFSDKLFPVSTCVNIVIFFQSDRPSAAMILKKSIMQARIRKFLTDPVSSYEIFSSEMYLIKCAYKYLKVCVCWL